MWTDWLFLIVPTGGMVGTVAFNEGRYRWKKRQGGSRKPKPYPWAKPDKSSGLDNAVAASREMEVAKPAIKTYEMYGHPAAPLLVLQASLPSAPIGYGWEITVTKNEFDNPAIRLVLLDLRTVEEVDAIEQDLVVIRRWKYANDDTYAAFYRRVEEIGEKNHRQAVHDWQNSWERRMSMSSLAYREPPMPKPGDTTLLAGKVMMANLIVPMVDWASLLVLRYIVDHPDPSKCNYVLLEATA